MTNVMNIVNPVSESSKHDDDAPLLEEYDFETKNQEKKSQLRKFFHNTLGSCLINILRFLER
jgi:hypothetical protein